MVFIKNMFVTLTIVVIAIWVMLPATAKFMEKVLEKFNGTNKYQNLMNKYTALEGLIRHYTTFKEYCQGIKSNHTELEKNYQGLRSQYITLKDNCQDLISKDTVLKGLIRHYTTFKEYCQDLISEYTILKDNGSDFDNMNWKFIKGDWDYNYLSTSLNDIKQELNINCEVNKCRDDKEVVLQMLIKYGQFLDAHRHDSEREKKPLSCFCKLALSDKLFQTCIIKTTNSTETP